MTQNTLRDLITKSIGFQKTLFYGMGIVSALTGIGILIATIAIPPKPGEEMIVLGLQVTAVVFILFCGWCFWYVRQRMSSVLELVFDTPDQVVSVKSVTVRKNGVHGYAIRLYTKDQKMVGFNVTDSQTQKTLFELLVEHLPNVELK